MTDRIRELETEVARLKGELLSMERGAFDPTLQSIAEQIPDNVMLIDREYRIRYINWTVPELTIERVLGTHVIDYVPDQHRASVVAMYERSFATGLPQRLEYEYYSADGSISKWVTRTVPLKQPNGAIQRLLTISTDITEREEAARDLDRFFRLSLDMLCVATLQGFFKRVSPAFTSVLGWSAEELLVTPFLDFVHADDRAATILALEGLRNGERVANFENRYQVKAGGYRILEWSSIPDVERGLIYAVARDITERRELEAALAQSRKMESIGQLAGGVAHDFNNLILAIQLNAQLAAETAEAAQRREHLEEIKNATMRAGELTKQLLLLGRKQPARATATDLGALIAQMSRMLSRTIPASVRVEFRNAASGARALVEPAHIEQVLLNLCLNARDAMPSGGVLTIALERREVGDSARRVGSFLAPGSYLVISVSDTGTGMTPDVAERAFEPFFTTKPPGAGTGLGLSTVYGIVKQHRGAVRVDTQPGHGSSIHVYLPQTDAEPEPKPIALPESKQGGNETILVAEDFEPVRRVVVKLLEGAGYRVIVARDGGEALDAIRARGREIALALLDVMMPVRTGAEVAELGMAIHPALRVLFTSGYNESSHSEAAIPDERLLRKPYVPDDLLARVRRELL